MSRDGGRRVGCMQPGAVDSRANYDGRPDSRANCGSRADTCALPCAVPRASLYIDAQACTHSDTRTRAHGDTAAVAHTLDPADGDRRADTGPAAANRYARADGDRRAQASLYAAT